MAWFRSLVFVLSALYFVLCTLYLVLCTLYFVLGALYLPACHSTSIKNQSAKHQVQSTKYKAQTSNLPIEFSRAVARNTQTLPIRGAKMFRQKNYLTNVVGIVSSDMLHNHGNTV